MAGGQTPRLILWEVCAEMVDNLPVRKVSEPRCGIRPLVVLSGYASDAGVNVLPPCREEDISQYWHN